MMFGRNSDAIVAYNNDQIAILSHGFQVNIRVLRRIFKRIINQITDGI